MKTALLALIAASVLVFVTACAAPSQATQGPSSAERQAQKEKAVRLQPLNMEIFQPPYTY